MKKAILTTVVALTTCAASAFAADFNGNIELGTRYNDVIGNKGKANEYRDASINQAIANFEFGLSMKNYYLELEGKSGFSLNADSKNQERTDQSYLLKGGQYDNFKYSLFFNEIPHHITSGAQTLYPGAGTANLGAAPVTSAATVAAMNAAPKYNVDYSITRKNYGAAVEASLKSPFFLSARAERNETNGTLPLGTYLSQIKEIPMPVNYLTDNLYLETGYRTRNLVATIDGTISSFHEQNSTILAFTGASQNITQPPSNEYFKVGGSVKYDIPSIKSTLMARGSYSKATNDQTLFDPLVNTVPTAAQVAGAGNGTLFRGDINYTTASASLVSNPTNNLDTRLFMNYLSKKNESNTGFAYRTPLTNTPENIDASNTEGFGYHKINGGLDIGYKLPAKTKLSAGYEYLNLVRAIRTDATKTTDHTAYVQVRNTLFDWMSAKVRAQHMYREGKFETAVNAAAAGNGYFRPFDAATKTQDQIKVGFDFEPLHNVSLGVEYAYKIDQYRDSIMGVQNAKSHDVYFDSNITAGPFKFNPYFDLELSDQASKHRAGNNVIAVNTPTQYNWINDAENVYYAVGLNSEVTLIKDRLLAYIGARYEKSDGSERFATDQSAVDSNNLIVNNKYLDTYIRKSITGKLTAKFTKQLTATAAYTFEKLQYTDDHYTGYTNYLQAGYALTGAYNNPDYTAHIGFLSLAYNF